MATQFSPALGRPIGMARSRREHTVTRWPRDGRGPPADFMGGVRPMLSAPLHEERNRDPHGRTWFVEYEGLADTTSVPPRRTAARLRTATLLGREARLIGPADADG